MNSGQRSRIGFIGSIVTHIFILLFVSFVGLFNISHQPASDIVEVSLFGGGGGGGNDADIEDNTGADEATTEEDVQEEETPQPDAIWQNDENKAKPVEKKKAAVKRAVKKGSGTGQGSGHGSGVGHGTGSGSGGGNGSGHGTGNGSGTGSGSGGGSGNGNASVAYMPRIVRKVDPTYPAAERNAGITGSGVVRLLVNTNGTVDEVTLVSSSGNANLDQAGINAAYKWRFTSAVGTNGQKVRCYLRLPFTFRLR
ncbi:energy transducer TonB [Phascolarctobacterium succinatutens]|uniref:energy transducer TonB n=1 Tax=Phascolarctobacterium succinatutens TaxID=626940 RepID=UPI003A954E06